MKSFYLTFSFAFLSLFLFRSCRPPERGIRVEDMRCEYLVNPLGIDRVHPRFSWIISGSRRGISQSAYRITVTSDGGKKKKVWDSGKVFSAKTTNIAYQGSPLSESTKYFWHVEVWDERGQKAAVSPEASFQTGLFSRSAWQARWIMAKDTALSAPLLRKEFRIDKKVKYAWAYVSGLGQYEFYLNGKKIGDHVLDPARTDFRKRVLYATYDITDRIRKGDNAAGIMLGNGTYRVRAVEGRYGWSGHTPRTNTPRALIQMDIVYRDGSRAHILSDTSWRYAPGPVTFNHVYGGEDYDARLEQRGWSTPEFDDSKWKKVVPAAAPEVILQSQLMPPVQVIRTFQPVAETHPEAGVTLFDLGQNFAGWWRIRIQGRAGLTVRIRGAETLNDSLFPKPLEPGDRLSTKFAYHAKVWTDYTLRGEGVEEYEPRFFYTGYRYAEVRTDHPEQIVSLTLEGREVGTALETAGIFASSDSLLNRIWRAGRRAQRGNLVGVPTDCPHREKGGYTGDGEIIAETSIHDFRMASLYTKWLNDMRDSQEENGRIPNTAPTLIGGYGGGIAWGSAYILIPWWMYQYYTDSTVMEDHYPTMKKYLDYLHRLARTDANPAEPYIINNFGTYWYSLGEWCAPGESDGPNHPVVNTAYYYLDALTLSRIAGILGRKKEADRYAALADTIRRAFNRKFFHPAGGLYGTDSLYQTYQVLALALGLVPEEHREQVLEGLIRDIAVRRDNHLHTGIIGTKYLWRVLADNGYSDLAFRIATQTTYPGYGFWISKGATTLWEKWEGTNSHNHQMFGTVSEFFYQYLAGIRSPEEEGSTPGYKHILIQPFLPKGLSHAGGSVTTVHGKVVSRWSRSQGKVHLHVEIPANSSATIGIPEMQYTNIKISEGDKTVWKENTFIPGTPGIRHATAREGHILFSVGSGTYDFCLSGQ